MSNRTTNCLLFFQTLRFFFFISKTKQMTNTIHSTQTKFIQDTDKQRNDYKTCATQKGAKK